MPSIYTYRKVCDHYATHELEPGERAELQQYQAHVERCRQWGREQRAALGA